MNLQENPLMLLWNAFLQVKTDLKSLLFAINENYDKKRSQKLNVNKETAWEDVTDSSGGILQISSLRHEMPITSENQWTASH